MKPGMSRAGYRLAVDPGQAAHAERNADDADRQIEQEDPAPGVVLHEPAGQHRADSRREQNRHAHHAHQHADLIGRAEPVDVGHGNRDDAAAAEALQDAEKDQHVGVLRRGAEHGAHGEQCDGGQEDVLGAKAVRQPSGQRDDGGLGQRIAGDGPLHGSERGFEVDDELLQGHVDGGAVEHDHEDADDDGDQRHQDGANPEWSCLLGSA